MRREILEITNPSKALVEALESDGFSLWRTVITIDQLRDDENGNAEQSFEVSTFARDVHTTGWLDRRAMPLEEK